MKERIMIKPHVSGIGDVSDLRSYTSPQYDWKISFYLVDNYGTRYLFSQDYTSGVYKYFKDGKAPDELRDFRSWKRNPRLDKTIEKISVYKKHVVREYLSG